MLVIYWILLVLVGTCILLLAPSIIGWSIYYRYLGPRVVNCPQTHGSASVRLDAMHAATTGLMGAARLRLASCSLWPERAGCAQECIGQAAAVSGVPPFPWARTVSKTWFGIYPPAVLAATAAYWLIAATWYSHFLFRARWMDLMGYSDPQVRAMVQASQPQLATLVWSLFFTLSLAVLVDRTGRYGAWKGATTGLMLWAPVWVGLVAVTVYQGWPVGLLVLHAGCTLIASLAAGAILGAWTPGRIVRALDRE